MIALQNGFFLFHAQFFFALSAPLLFAKLLVIGQIYVSLGAMTQVGLYDLGNVWSGTGGDPTFDMHVYFVNTDDQMSMCVDASSRVKGRHPTQAQCCMFPPPHPMRLKTARVAWSTLSFGLEARNDWREASALKTITILSFPACHGSFLAPGPLR